MLLLAYHILVVLPKSQTVKTSKNYDYLWSVWAPYISRLVWSLYSILKGWWYSYMIYLKNIDSSLRRRNWKKVELQKSPFTSNHSHCATSATFCITQITFHTSCVVGEELVCCLTIHYMDFSFFSHFLIFHFSNFLNLKNKFNDTSLDPALFPRIAY